MSELIKGSTVTCEGYSISEQIKEITEKRMEMLKFTPRERDVIRGILAGLSNSKIAEKLFVCDKTVKYHITNIFKTAGLNSRTQLIVALQKPFSFGEENYLPVHKSKYEVAKEKLEQLHIMSKALERELSKLLGRDAEGSLES